MLVEQITTDMTEALKDGQSDRLGVLRLIKTSIKNEEIKLGHPLDDEEALKVLQREAKQRRDSITAYRQAGRDDLATSEEAELTLIETYLPAQMSEAELTKLVDEAVAIAGPSAQMGQVIGAVRARAGASADGAMIARLVKERLP